MYNVSVSSISGFLVHAELASFGGEKIQGEFFLLFDLMKLIRFLNQNINKKSSLKLV